MRVGVRELKSRLSEYLGKVKAGEEVVVTERGRSIAKLVPMRDDEPLVPARQGGPSEDQSFEEHLADLERRGLIKRGTGKLPEGFWDFERPKVPEGTIQRALDEEREDRV